MPRTPYPLATLICAALATMTVLPSMPARAAPPTLCVATPVPTDSQDVACTLDPAMRGRPMHFVAQFGGSHDDTRIRLDATLDGEPLTCDDGSKTALFAEDGVVRLDCRFRVGPTPAGSAARLKVALTVHHAQYLSSSLDGDGEGAAQTRGEP